MLLIITLPAEIVFHVVFKRRRSWIAAVLRSIPKESFAESLQKLYERGQPCVVKDGDYFEGQ
jgi:hypothetical protein